MTRLNLFRSKRAANNLTTKLFDSVRQTDTVSIVKVACLDVKEPNAFLLVHVTLFNPTASVRQECVTVRTPMRSKVLKFLLGELIDVKLLQSIFFL